MEEWILESEELKLFDTAMCYINITWLDKLSCLFPEDRLSSES